jgi:hypothetical protein
VEVFCFLTIARWSAKIQIINVKCGFCCKQKNHWSASNVSHCSMAIRSSRAAHLLHMPNAINKYRLIKKSLCTSWLQYKKQAKIFYTVSITYHDNVVRIHSECGPCYTEHGLWEHSSACQSMSGDWRGTLWTLLVTFCIVIIRWAETLWSPCIIHSIYLQLLYFTFVIFNSARYAPCTFVAVCFLHIVLLSRLVYS